MEMPSVQSRLFAGRNRAALFSAAKILLIFLFFIMVRDFYYGQGKTGDTFHTFFAECFLLSGRNHDG